MTVKKICASIINSPKQRRIALKAAVWGNQFHTININTALTYRPLFEAVDNNNSSSLKQINSPHKVAGSLIQTDVKIQILPILEVHTQFT